MTTLGRLYRGETNIDFIGRRRLWLAVSGVLIAVSIGALFLRPSETPCRSLPTKGLNCGIEFNGGLSLTAPLTDPDLETAPSVDVVNGVRDALERVDAGDAQVQVAETNGQRQVIVQTRQVSGGARSSIVDAVATVTGADVTEVSSESISASFGGEVTQKAIRALIVFLIVILIFISWRFEWKMAVSGIAALLHDLIITAGVYAIVGFEVTPSTVIAILTILGYSLYDTVVVFDKVEENTNALAATGRMTYEGAANLAMNQVFMRSLNTSLATLLPVAALLFIGAGALGAGTLEDLALALFVGILSGTYSSIFFATPILSILKEREPKYRNVREKVMRDARRRTAQQPVTSVPATVGAPAEAESVAAEPARAAATAPSATKPKGTSRPTPKTRAGSKKAKRRRRR